MNLLQGRKESISAFTLIELLVVIGIIAILMVTVVIVMNPGQLLAQSRDSNRLSDLNNVNAALGLASVSQLSIGSSSVVYISVPDSSSTCGDLGLPALSSGWKYNCSPATTYKNVDGTGWIPLNLTKLDTGSPISLLPIDPVNSTSSGLYYSYITNGNTWVLVAHPESQKQIINLQQNPPVASDPGAWAVGSNISLLSSMGSFTGVTMNLSIANGYAFIDNSSLNLAPYIGKYITVSDGTNSVTGYISAQGTGETLGSNLVADPTCTTGSGWSVSGAGSYTYTGGACSGSGAYLRNTAGGTLGNLYKITVTLGSGSAVLYPYGVGGTIGSFGAGTTSRYYTGTGTFNSGFNGSSIVLTLYNMYQITTPGSSGVTIVNTQGGSTFNWTSNTGINVNSASFAVTISP